MDANGSANDNPSTRSQRSSPDMGFVVCHAVYEIQTLPQGDDRVMWGTDGIRLVPSPDEPIGAMIRREVLCRWTSMKESFVPV